MVGLVAGVGACGLAGRSAQANAISDAIRAIPGVAGVATGYKSDPFQGPGGMNSQQTGGR